MRNDFFYRRRKLMQKAKESRIKEKQIAKELESLRGTCNHEIVIKTLESSIKKDWYGRLRINMIPSEKTCLLCGKKFDETRFLSPQDIEKLSESVIIDMKNYPELRKEDNESFINKVENYYKLKKKEMPDASEFEIGKAIIDELEMLDEFLKHEN